MTVLTGVFHALKADSSLPRSPATAAGDRLPSEPGENVGSTVRYASKTIHAPTSSDNDETRELILSALYVERSELRTKSRVGPLSVTDELMLNHTTKAIERLQQRQVEQMRVVDESLWLRVEDAVKAMKLLPGDDR